MGSAGDEPAADVAKVVDESVPRITISSREFGRVPPELALTFGTHDHIVVGKVSWWQVASGLVGHGGGGSGWSQV